MKTINFLLFFLLITSNTFSQITFAKGYFIDNLDKKTDCLIKNVDWDKNPTQFKYKLSEGGEIQLKNIEQTKEFGIYNFSNYIRANVLIDRSSDNLDDIDNNNKDPKFKEEQLFLKVLLKGKATLYEYSGELIKRYFYSIDGSDIKQLIYKTYRYDSDKVNTNNQFRMQLWNEVRCKDAKMTDFEYTDYSRRDLTNVFIKYNNCFDSEVENFQPNKKSELNLSLKPRISNKAFEATEQRFKYNFENKTIFKFGLELESILNFNRGKWSLLTELSYESLSLESDIEINSLSTMKRRMLVDYNAISIAFGARHYLFLNNNSKLFINAMGVFNFVNDSSIETQRLSNANNITFSSNLDTRNNFNMAFGLGYMYKKLSTEFRVETHRQISKDIDTKYQGISLIFGYKLF